MNLVQLQDMLRGMPDDRLQTEMDQPSGVVPQYLVLSEIVRRDKARSSAAEAPKTTVVQDVMNQAQSMGGLGALMGQAPVAPDQGMQEQPAMYANGGFISPADAMGKAGFPGYPQPPQKQPFQLSSAPQSGGTMFTPNTNPAPAPQANFSLNNIPVQDDGVQNNANVPSFMEQPNGYANGGVIGLYPGGLASVPTPPGGQSQDLAFFIDREAERLGIDPVDLATAISYETAGTFDPRIKGKAKTKWGTHIGLIQMGDPQREQYGYNPEGSLDDQMKSVGDYLVDRGVKPGMGLVDIYSAINAGAPGLYNASDEKAGGAPGTVADKVRDQMAGHREKAMNLFQLFGQNPGSPAPSAPRVLTEAEKARLGPNAAQAIADANRATAAPTSLFAGIKGLLPDAKKLSGVGSDLRDIGSAMAQNTSAPEAPDAPMKGADVAGLDRLRTNPEEQLAQYAALRQQYITGAYANGGYLSAIGSGLRNVGSTMAQGQEAPEAPDAPMKPGDVSGLDRLRSSPEEDLSKYAALRQQYITGAYADGGTIRMADGSPGSMMHEGMYLGTTAETQPEKDPRSLWQWMTGVDPAVAAAQAENEKIKQEAEDSRLRFEADPEYRARILAEKGPMNGDAVSPPEAKEIAAKSQLSPYQLLTASQEKQQKMLQDYYDQLIQLEKDRMSESQGFGAFLKELGRGMLSNTSAFGPSVAAGASRAIGSREDIRSAAANKLNELALAKKKAEIEGIGALDKLRYQQLVGDPLSTREKLQYGASYYINLAEQAQKDGDVDLAKAYRDAAQKILKDAGMGVDVKSTAAPTEAETDTGFWSILGKI